MNGKFPNLGPCELKIFKFGGLIESLNLGKNLDYKG